MKSESIFGLHKCEHACRHLPKPLIGARMMGIPDLVFCMIVIIATVGLLLLYFKLLRQKTESIVKTLLKPFLAVF